MSKLVEKVGNWDLALRVARNLKLDIRQELTVVLKQVGAQGERMMKLYIRNQEGHDAPGDLRWAYLSREYHKRKVREGLSYKTLIASSSMMQSITNYAVYPKVYVGIKRGAENSKGGDLVKIGAVMEFGSKKMNIPERPFVRPVAEKLMGEVVENNLIGRRLINYIRKKHGF